MVFRRCHIHIYDNWGTSYLVSRLVPANIVAPRIIAWNDNYLRWKRERLSDSKIVIGRSAFIDLIVWRVIPIPCDTIFQPRYCTRMWSCHPVCARNGTNPWICACKGWHGIACRYDDVPRSKIEGLADSHPMISHIHIVLLTIRIIFVVPRNRSSGQILLHIWIVSGICIIYDDGSPVRVVFHWHYIHKNYRWEASSEDSRRGTRTFIFSPCNIIRKEDHLWWEREGYPMAVQKYSA